MWDRIAKIALVFKTGIVTDLPADGSDIILEWSRDEYAGVGDV